MFNKIKQSLALSAVFFFSLISVGIYAEESVKNEKTEKSEPSISEAGLDGYEPAHAILDGKKIRFSGYGGPAVRFMPLNNSLGVMTGGKGGMIVNDSLVIGGAGYGLVYPDSTDYSRDSMHLGYGGFLLEYILFPKSIINFSLGTLIGAGNSNYSTFFVVEPEINVFVNITRFFKIGISGSYRYTSGLNNGTLTDESFRGFSGGLIFEFGKF